MTHLSSGGGCRFYFPREANSSQSRPRNICPRAAVNRGTTSVPHGLTAHALTEYYHTPHAVTGTPVASYYGAHATASAHSSQDVFVCAALSGFHQPPALWQGSGQLTFSRSSPFQTDIIAVKTICQQFFLLNGVYYAFNFSCFECIMRACLQIQ